MLELFLQWDEAGLKFVNQVFTNSYFDWFFPLITDLHDTLFFKVILVPALFLTLIYKYKKKGLILFFMALVSLGVSDGVGNHGFKKTVQRPRPHTVLELGIIQRTPSAGYSFISNHSTNMFNFATYFATFFPQYKILLFSMASLVAYSRVYNGAHYPSDVLLGAILGILIGLMMARMSQRMIKKWENEKL